MRARLALLGLCAAGLVGGGAWLVRSTTSASGTPPEMASAAVAARDSVEPAGRPSAAPSRAATPRRAPDLAPRATSADPALSADLVDADPKVRRAAIRELAGHDAPDPAMLLAASRDRDVEAAALAMDALGKLHASGTITAQDLIERASDRSLDDRVRVAALNGLGVVPSADAAQTFVEMLARGDVIERRSAAILLVHQDPAIAVPALIAALGDSDESVRWSAHESLRARSRGRDFGTDAAAWRTWWQSRTR